MKDPDSAAHFAGEGLVLSGEGFVGYLDEGGRCEAEGVPAERAREAFSQSGQHCALGAASPNEGAVDAEDGEQHGGEADGGDEAGQRVQAAAEFEFGGLAAAIGGADGERQVHARVDTATNARVPTA